MAQAKAAPPKPITKTKIIPTPEEKKFSDWIAYGIFALLTIIFFKAQLFGEKFFWEDFTELVYPNWTFAARHLANLEIPYWNPYIFCGAPFMADMQNQVFYPLNWIMAFFVGDNGRVPVEIMQFVIILHYFIAQIGMYKLLRSFGRSQIASVLGAVAYGFSGSLVMRAFHPIILYQLAWFPLILMFFYRAITQIKFSSAIAAGLVLGISMLAGQPQTTLYNAFFLFVLTIWIFIAKVRTKEISGASIVQYLLCAALPIAIGAGIFMIQYLPSSELASLSERATMTYEKAADGSLQFSQIFTSIVPRLFGFTNIENPQEGAQFYLEQTYYYWETAFYCGIATVILAIFAMVRRWKNRLISFLIFAAIFGFLFSLGKNGFVFPVFFELPFFKLFRSPARMMTFVSLALVILSAFGFDELWKKTDDKRQKIFLLSLIVPLIVALGVATGSILGIIKAPQQFYSDLQSYGATALVFIVVIAALLFMLVRRIFSPLVCGALLLFITFTELYMQGGSFNIWPTDPDQYYQTSNKENLQPKLPNDLFRVTMRTPGAMAMPRNQGTMDSIMLYEGYTTLALQRRGTGALTQEENLDLLNMKYGVVLDANRQPVGFAQRQNFFPRAWIVYDAKISSPEKVLATMQSGVDFRKSVVLEEQKKNSLSGRDAASIRHEIKAEKYSHNYIRYNVQTPENGILCFSEIYYPEWQGYLDGKPVKILHANNSLRAIEVPEGTHTVEMRYEDKKFVLGASITGFTFFASIFSLLFTAGIDRKRRKENFSTKENISQ